MSFFNKFFSERNIYQFTYLVLLQIGQFSLPILHQYMFQLNEAVESMGFLFFFSLKRSSSKMNAGVSCVQVGYQNLPKMGGRVAPEENQGLHWIHIGINPSCPCCQSFSKCLGNIQFIIYMATLLIVTLPASLYYRFY